eukprot:TRINITY_DN22606_c0_g1_i1.p1 TRINITY_DN22606_c0_g1~~TRINITY_DN22606_c0_g1_i1.p1  ORF type:complete len:411 (+),score=49.37 TRINITY_DN22606_c0_g1_i1:93-1325(+)
MSVDSVTVAAEQPVQASFLAFGDSLTSGVIASGVAHPYSRRLSQLLGPECNVVNAGWAGQQAVHMRYRLQQELQRGLSPFSFTIVLAGSNDLRVGTSEEEIARAILALHQTAVEMGTRCVAVTVPRYGPRDSAFKPQGDRRAHINKRIKEAVAQAESGKMIVADFDAALEAQQPASVRDALFCDSCHFTPAGYNLLADVIYKAIKEAGWLTTLESPSIVRKVRPAEAEDLPVLLKHLRLASKSEDMQHKVGFMKKSDDRGVFRPRARSLEAKPRVITSAASTVSLPVSQQKCYRTSYVAISAKRLHVDPPVAVSRQSGNPLVKTSSFRCTKVTVSQARRSPANSSTLSAAVSTRSLGHRAVTAPSCSTTLASARCAAPTCRGSVRHVQHSTTIRPRVQTATVGGLVARRL